MLSSLSTNSFQNKTYLVFCIALMASLTTLAQKDIPNTTKFSIEGRVKKSVEINIESLQGYKTISIDSLVITNHLRERRNTIKNIKGIALKEILTRVDIDVESPKQLSEYYFECMATDGYKVVYSWNELFNNELGDKAILIIEKDGEKGKQIRDGIAIISASDLATGRRFVKSLQKIIVRRI